VGNSIESKLKIAVDDQFGITNSLDIEAGYKPYFGAFVRLGCAGVSVTLVT